MKPIPTEEFLQKLQLSGVVDDARIGVINEQQEEQADLLVAEILRDIDALDWPVFLQLLSEEFGVDYFPPEYLMAMAPEESVLDIIPSAQAQELIVFPLDYDAVKDRLLLLTAYPFNLHVLDELESVLGISTIQLAFSDEKTVGELHQKHYIGNEDVFDVGEDSGGFDIGAGSEEEAFPGIYGSSVSDLDDSADDSSVKEGVTEEDEGVRGSLAHLGLVDMLQALGQSRKTCAIYLESGDWYGNMHLVDGLIVHAESSSATGEDACFEILAREKGHFEILKRPFSGEKTMEQSVEAMLMEGMRRMDEANR